MPLNPGVVDLIAAPAAPTVVQSAFGTSGAISYQIVSISAGGQDSAPSAATTTPANNASTPSNALTWVGVPGATGYRVIKNSTLLANVGPGVTTYTDTTNGNGSAYTPASTNPTALVPTAASLIDGAKWTYRTTKQGLVVAASATDFAVLSGSASKIVRVTHVEVSGIATTILETSIQALIRTTADSGGTSTGSPTAYPHDQNAPAATASVLTYTANPTVNDGSNRLVASQKVLFNLAAPTAASECTRFILDFGNRPSQAVVLRGVAQQLALNLNGVTVAGPSLDITFEWTEE